MFIMETYNFTLQPPYPSLKTQMLLTPRTRWWKSIILFAHSLIEMTFILTFWRTVLIGPLTESLWYFDNNTEFIRIVNIIDEFKKCYTILTVSPASDLTLLSYGRETVILIPLDELNFVVQLYRFSKGQNGNVVSVKRTSVFVVGVLVEGIEGWKTSTISLKFSEFRQKGYLPWLLF